MGTMWRTSKVRGATPTFGFNNILALAQDAPNNENGVFYNPATGHPAIGQLGRSRQNLRAFCRRYLEGQKKSDSYTGPAL